MKLIQWFGLAVVEHFGNVGIVLGLTMLVLILLRPVLVRTLRPRFRVTLWMVTWLMGWGSSFYSIVKDICILPVTFRGLVIPRSIDGGRVPGFLPDLREVGEKVLTLPGGTEVPFLWTEGVQTAVGLLVAVLFGLMLWWTGREEKRLRPLVKATPAMSDEWHRAHGIDPDSMTVRVRIGEGLPTNFVCRVESGVHTICLQKELPSEQMELVLRHELAHVRGSHPWFKGLLVVLLVFYWWNPLVWVAYRLTCRDLELACDEAVLKELDEKQRREYARTLVELGSGKHLWGGLTSFGECDAEIRVRRAVDWKGERVWEPLLFWPLLVLAFLFLFTSPRGSLASRETAWQDYIQSTGVEEDIRQFSGDPEVGILEVWARDKTLLVHTDDGKWYLTEYKWDRDMQGYRWRSHMVLKEEPEKYEFVRVACWDNVGRRDDTLWSDYVSGPKLEEDLRRLMDYPVEVLGIFQKEEGKYLQKVYILLDEDYWPWWECSFERNDREGGVWKAYRAEKLEAEEMDVTGLTSIDPWPRTGS